MTIQLGIAPINWSNDDDPNLGKEYSFEQCIEEMQIAGYEGTELGNKFPNDPQLLKTALQEKKLVLSSAWFSTFFTDPQQYESTLSAFMDKLSFVKATGARYLNICECAYAIQGTEQPVLSAEKPVFTKVQWQDLIRGLHSIGRIANDHHMQLVYHYHAGTGVFFEDEIDYLMEHVSPQLVSLLLDTGHAAFAGIDPVNLIRKHGERIGYVHLKDIRASVLDRVAKEQLCFMDAVRAGVFTVPGDGNLNFPAVFSELEAYQYQGWMIVEAEQDPAKAPPLIYAKKAKEYLESIKYARMT